MSSTRPIPIPETNTTTQSEWVEANGIKFFTKRWIPESGIIQCYLIFCHGFVEHIERYDHVFPIYAQKGIEVLAFDQRGFGQTAAATNSFGKTSWNQAFQDLGFFLGGVIKKAKEDGDKKVFLMGHSMGGGLVFGYATRNPALKHLSSLSGILCSGPLIRQAPKAAANLTVVKLGGIVGKVLPGLQMKVGKEPDPKKRLEEGKTEEGWRSDICRDKEVVKAYEADPLCTPLGTYKGISDMLLGGNDLLTKDYKNYDSSLPIIFMHGTGDRVTSFEATEELAKRVTAEDKEMKAWPDYWHELHNEPGDDKWQEINYASDWIVKRKDAPSLADKNKGLQTVHKL